MQIMCKRTLPEVTPGEVKVWCLDPADTVVVVALDKGARFIE